MSLPMQKASYPAHAIAIALSASSKKKTPQVVVTFEIVFEGGAVEEITWFGFLSDAAINRTIESLGHCGWSGDDLEELAKSDPRISLPNDVTIVCAPETYDGTNTLKVQWVNRLGQGAAVIGEPIEGDHLRTFAASMKASIRAARTAAGSRAGSAPVRAQAPAAARGDAHPNAPGGSYPGESGGGFGDDIPFATCEPGAEPSPVARVLR